MIAAEIIQLILRKKIRILLLKKYSTFYCLLNQLIKKTMIVMSFLIRTKESCLKKISLKKNISIYSKSAFLLSLCKIFSNRIQICTTKCFSLSRWNAWDSQQLNILNYQLKLIDEAFHMKNYLY